MTPTTPASSATRLHLLIIFSYAAYLTWPAWADGFLPSRDTLIHLLWSHNFVEQFWAGEFYPRWLGAMNAGLGSPTFFFYAPLPYVLTALLHPLLQLGAWLGLPLADPEGWRLLGLSASVAVLASGLTCYAWLRRIVPAPAALLAALFYLSAPYHLTIDLYQRFGFGELWAFVWLPLIIWATDALCRERPLALPALAAALAALLLTHLPTTLLFSPLLPLYVLWHSPARLRLRIVLRLGLAVLLSALLAALYLAPALLTQANVSLQDMRGQHMDYGYNYLLWGPRFSADLAQFNGFLGQIALFMSVICVAGFCFTRRSRLAGLQPLAGYWLLIGLATLLIMTPLAAPLWDALPPLQTIQFPWRLLTVLTLAATVLLALWLGSLSHQPFSLLSALLLALLLVGLALQTLPTLINYQAMAGSPGPASMAKWMENIGTRHAGAYDYIVDTMRSKDTQEYRPRWVPHNTYFNSRRLQQLASSTQQNRAAAGYQLQRLSARHLRLTGSSSAAQWLSMEQFYYPGWQARLSSEAGVGSPTRLLDVRPEPDSGLLQIQLPPGNHRVDLILTRTWPERLGLIVSFTALLLWLWLTWRKWPAVRKP